jgi:hypothetical protein
MQINSENFVRGPRGSLRSGEPGFVIILVAVFLLFVVGAMAALSIDVVTFYTARSEAQLAADAAALAGARVLANSGATSDINTPDDNMLANARALALAVATQVAISNSVGGRNLLAPEVTVNFNGVGPSPCSATLQMQVANPCVTVTVTRTDLPVFFARIWGNTQITISASATAEAYNPSGLATDTTISMVVPVAPSCVKPWVLPNIDPTNPTGQIFASSSGQIMNANLLGATFPNSSYPTTLLHARCGGSASCDVSQTPQPWAYFAGTDISFPHPIQALPACSVTTNFQFSIAGCVQLPIICGAAPASQVTIVTTTDTTLDPDAAAAVDCLAHTSGGKGDTISALVLPPTPFEFTAKDDNPLVQAGSLASGSQTMVSDSLVTVPVFDSPSVSINVGNTVTIIGFLQLFLQPSGQSVGSTGGQIESKIINMVGCGLNSNATNSILPAYGNGASAVPVRLISPR